MQIQLKQTEIIAALKQYISGQGINLVGKEVTISFTAGRKEAGVTADLVIEDAGIPGFDDAQEEAVKPVLTVVALAPAPQETPTPQAAEEPPFATEAAPAEPKTPPTSLFN
jgi:hypothetical protein